MSRLILTLVAMVVWAVVAMGQRARAQDALGDGRALDSNLQVGSGGINQPGQAPAYLRANDVITGNVSGLGFFRDNVGYGATGEFGDRLGSDDLFRIQARNLAPGQSAVCCPGLQTAPEPVRRSEP